MVTAKTKVWVCTLKICRLWIWKLRVCVSLYIYTLPSPLQGEAPETAKHHQRPALLHWQAVHELTARRICRWPHPIRHLLRQWRNVRFGGLQLAFEAWLTARIGFGSKCFKASKWAMTSYPSKVCVWRLVAGLWRLTARIGFGEQMSHDQLPFEGVRFGGL
jgi:hypothetical protein